MSLSCGGLGSPSAWGGEGGVGGDHPLAEHGHRHHGNSLPASAVIGCQGQTEAFAPPQVGGIRLSGGSQWRRNHCRAMMSSRHSGQRAVVSLRGTTS